MSMESVQALLKNPNKKKRRQGNPLNRGIVDAMQRRMKQTGAESTQLIDPVKIGRKSAPSGPLRARTVGDMGRPLNEAVARRLKKSVKQKRTFF
jgi:hypothetical protein